MVTEAPKRLRNFEVYVTLASIYHDSQAESSLVKTMKKMDSLFVQSSVWTKSNSKETETLEKAKDKTKRLIHRYGTLYHQQGMKGKKDNLLNAALDLYGLYLKSFPKEKDAYELRYYFAEIHFHFKNFDRAADEYVRVSRMEGKYLEPSARRAVVAMKKIDEKQKYKKLPPLGQVNKKIPLPKVKKKFIKIIDNFVELLPKHKDGHAMRYTAAYTLFEYGHYPKALERFGDIVNIIPKSKQGKASVEMIIGYYSERRKWDELIAVCRKFLGNENIGKSKLKNKLLSTLRESLFGQAVRLSKNKKYMKSAKAFVAYQEEFPKAKNADDALYNATFNYYKDGAVEAAISKGKILLKKYPKSSHASKTILDIAQTNEALAEFYEAATYYEMFHKRFSKDKKSRLALINAATLYRGLKKYDQSIAALSTFIRKYPKNSLAKDAIKMRAEVYKQNKNYRKAVKAYEDYASKQNPKSAEFYLAKAKAAEIEGLYGSKKKSARMFASLYKQLVKKDSTPAFDARRIVARAMFQELDKYYVAFKNVKIKNAKRIEREVKTKQEKLKNLVQKYQNIIDLGSGEYTVASLYRVGELHENFAEELFKAPAPKGASQLEINQYRSAIEKVAFPLRDESEKYFTLAHTRSKEVQTFTNWTRLARNKMTVISSTKYPAITEKNVDPAYLSHRLLWQESVAEYAQ